MLLVSPRAPDHPKSGTCTAAFGKKTEEKRDLSALALAVQKPFSEALFECFSRSGVLLMLDGDG